nr:histidine kinase dimerization/phosphoacceptor domain -containing protein [Spirochaetales bacterium]
SRGARLKRIIILPFFVVTALGFALSWVLYVNGSRAAVSDAIRAIAVESSKRVTDQANARLGHAVHVASANAAFLGTYPRIDDETTAIRLAFVEQLRHQPMMAIAAIGMENGDYLEAQRIGPDSYRVGAAGAVTGGSLVFRPVLDDGGFGELYVEAPGYDPRERPWYRAAIEADGLAWSRPYSIFSTNEPAVAVSLPVRRDGEVFGVAVATVELGTLSAYLATVEEARNGVAFVEDEEGRLIASSRSTILDVGGERAVAVIHWDPLVAAAARADGEARSGGDSRAEDSDDPVPFSFTLRGASYLGVSRPVRLGADQAWRAVLAVPQSAYTEKLRQTDAKAFIVLLAFLATSLTVGWLVVDYVTRPIRAIADAVDALEPGSPLPDDIVGFFERNNELGRLARSFAALKLRLDDSFGELEGNLAEKDVLLREIHHRVKNNLQVVSSILSIEAGSIDDERARVAFDKCQNRIQAMALVHEEVYRTGSFVELDMTEYLTRICESLRWGSGSKLKHACETALVVRADDGDRLPLDKAIPCGLVVNELVANAMERAAPDRPVDTVTVEFRRADSAWRLSVSDDGPAGDDGPKADATAGACLDLQLAEGLVAQLGGVIRREPLPDGGTLVIVDFPA